MKSKPETHKNLFLFSALATAFIVFAIIGFILMTAAPVLIKEGFGFIFGTTWDYTNNQYGAWVFLTGTLVLTAVTMIMAVPLGIATAVFLSEWAPPWLDRPLTTLIELLVGVPSVVFGILGFVVFRDYFRYTINPFIAHTLGFIPIFQIQSTDGFGIPLASAVLTLMILPTIIVLSREAMHGVPAEQREASAALGATEWETIRDLILPSSLSGITTGVILGTMRAMGETMAVVMLAGGAPVVPTSVLDSIEPMTAKILNDLGYYIVEPEPRSALFAIGVLLMVMEICFVAAIHLITARMNRKYSGAK
jgi:phosphate transport system permease protein